jgi:hypothetical protein
MIFIINTLRTRHLERHERLTKHTPSRNNSWNNSWNNKVKSELRRTSGILDPDLHSSSFVTSSHLTWQATTSSPKRKLSFPLSEFLSTLQALTYITPRRSRVEYSGALPLCSVICCIHYAVYHVLSCQPKIYLIQVPACNCFPLLSRNFQDPLIAFGLGQGNRAEIWRSRALPVG